MRPNRNFNPDIDTEDGFDGLAAPRRMNNTARTETQDSRNSARRQPRERTARPDSGGSRRPTPDPVGPNPPKKRPARKPAAPSYTFVDFLKDYRTRLGIVIFLCIISIVTAVCCISFLFNNSVDQ
ncbi:MAG: hypothetical protein K2F79_06585, partial [Muribaculaceae bacterium]|nr:hypothetical protein [Muribaculaceae bacterium]